MFTFKFEEQTITVTITTNETMIHDVVDEFRRFLLACGYHPDNVKGALPDAP
jgi:hypothetical protein